MNIEILENQAKLSMEDLLGKNKSASIPSVLDKALSLPSVRGVYIEIFVKEDKIELSYNQATLNLKYNPQGRVVELIRMPLNKADQFFQRVEVFLGRIREADKIQASKDAWEVSRY